MVELESILKLQQDHLFIHRVVCRKTSHQKGMSMSPKRGGCISRMISTAEVGTLEGEAKGKATRIAADEVKELEALDVATIDYSEAEKRQHVSPLLQNAKTRGIEGVTTTS